MKDGASSELGHFNVELDLDGWPHRVERARSHMVDEFVQGQRSGAGRGPAHQSAAAGGHRPA
jgi:hypothetical protein